MNEERNDITIKKSKKAKKALIIILISVAAVIVLLLVSSFCIDFYQDQKNEQQTAIDFDFYPADYEEDIYSDYEYVEKITGQFIQFNDPTGNMGIIGIDREDAKDFGGEKLEFIVEMLYDIIDGDAEGYNARFSDIYYQKNQPKTSFTKQKIYDVVITYVPEESTTDGNYTKSVYCIEYKILKNNGTFRNDIGTGSRKQYITISDASGKLLIDSVVNVKLQFVN